MPDTKVDFDERFSKLNVCVIIPTYNNCKTVEDVLKGVLEYSESIIVVNDGSDDGTKEILARYPKVKTIHHHPNKGKGAALKTAFNEAYERGYEYAITIDSDGQHKTFEIPLFLDTLAKQPGALMIGARNLNQKSLPGKNNFANRFSNFWFRFIAGVRLPDTQSGYRLYPLKKIEKLKLFSGKYEYELEILVKAAWKGIEIISIPIDAYYPPAEERVTHFRPFRDFFRISMLNTVLFFIAVFYIKPKHFFKILFRK